MAVLAAWLAAGAGPAGSGAGDDGNFREVAVADGDDGFDAVAADPHRQRMLWAASGSRVLASGDGGLTWCERVRLPGFGTGGGLAPEPAVPAPTAILAELEDATDDLEALPAGPGRVALPATVAGPERTPRIRALRVGDGLWIAATDGVYRWSGGPADPLPRRGPDGTVRCSTPGPSEAAGRLERFAVPGGAAVLAVAPDPLRPRAAWLATAAGLWHVDGALVTRAPGAVGLAPSADVDAVRFGASAVVAVAAASGLFVSADGGARFVGPLPLGVGAGAAAVTLGTDGRGVVASADGGLAGFDREGRLATRVATGLGRNVRRLHLVGAGPARRLWIAGADGLFRQEADGAVERVSRRLPSAGVRDVVTPAGRPDRPLVATDRGLFLAAEAERGPGFPPPGRSSSPPFREPARQPAREPASPPAREPASPPARESVPPPAREPARPPAPENPSPAAPSRPTRDAGTALGLPDLGLADRVRRAPLLPVLEASWAAVPAAHGDRDTWAVTASWDLARLFGPDGAAVSAGERRCYRARRALALRLERVLRARGRLLAAGNPGDEVDRALAILAVDEQEARLDGFGVRTSAGADAPARRDPW